MVNGAMERPVPKTQGFRLRAFELRLVPDRTLRDKLGPARSRRIRVECAPRAVSASGASGKRLRGRRWLARRHEDRAVVERRADLLVAVDGDQLAFGERL